MRRREFISLFCGAATLWPLAARGQQARRLRRIGIITGGGPTPAFAGFAQGMQDLGYIEGRDFAIEWRFAEGNYERHREFAADLVRQNVDVIVVSTTSALPATAGNFHHTHPSPLFDPPPRPTLSFPPPPPP